MRFLIYESAYIQGVLHPCVKGQTAILELPDASNDVSVRWKPLDEVAQAAQVRVKRAVRNELTGDMEYPALKIDANSAAVLGEKWKGHPIVDAPDTQFDGKTPVKVMVHEDTLAPIGEVELKGNRPRAEAVDAVANGRPVPGAPPLPALPAITGQEANPLGA